MYHPNVRRVESAEAVKPADSAKIGASFTPKPQEKTPLLGVDQ